MEIGQGITTSTAMLIAEELDLPVDKVHVTLAPGPPRADVQPAHRRLEHHGLDLHPDPGRRRRSPRARCSTPPPIELGDTVGQPDSQGRRDHRARRAQRDVRRAGRRRRPAAPTRAVDVAAQGPLASSPSSAPPQNRLDAPRPRSPGASSTPSTSTSRTRCRRWSAGRPRSTARPKGLRNQAAVAGDARASPTSRWSPPASPCARETFGQCIDAVRALDVDWNRRHGGRRVRRDGARRARRPPRCRWPSRRSARSPRRSRPSFTF